jgi:hypothetical protein
MGKQLQFSFHGSVTIDDVTRSAMQDEGYDPENAVDVAEWFGGHRELCALADTHDYSIA